MRPSVFVFESYVSLGILVVAWSLTTSQGHHSLRQEGGGMARIFQQWFGCRGGRIVRVFGVVGVALASQYVVAVQLLSWRQFVGSFARRMYAFCEVICLFCFVCASIHCAHNLCLLHMWQDLAEVS